MSTRHLRTRLSVVIGITGVWLAAVLLSTTAQWGSADALSARLTFSSPIPQLSLAKTVSQPAPKPNDLITYVLAYSNTQASTQAFNVRLYDFLPAGVQFQSAAPPAASYDNGVLLFTAPSIGPATGNMTVSVTVRVLEGYEQLYNHALLTADGVTPTQASLLTGVQQPAAWLKLTKTGPQAVLVNGQLVYTLICENTSGIAVNDVTVIEVLPAGLSFVSAFPSPSTQTPPVLSWSLGDLGPGEKRTIVMTTTAPASVGAIINTALADARQRVMTQTLLTTQVITEGAILDVAKGGPETVSLGGELVYTIRYRNVGNSPAAGVVLTDTFPADISVIDVDPEATSLTSQWGVWSIGPVGPASPEYTIVITASVRGNAGRTLLNVVDITGQTGFPDHAEWQTQVRPILVYMPIIRRNR